MPFSIAFTFTFNANEIATAVKIFSELNSPISLD